MRSQKKDGQSQSQGRKHHHHHRHRHRKQGECQQQSHHHQRNIIMKVFLGLVLIIGTSHSTSIPNIMPGTPIPKYIQYATTCTTTTIGSSTTSSVLDFIEWKKRNGDNKLSIRRILHGVNHGRGRRGTSGSFDDENYNTFDTGSYHHHDGRHDESIMNECSYTSSSSHSITKDESSASSSIPSTPMPSSSSPSSSIWPPWPFSLLGKNRTNKHGSPHNSSSSSNSINSEGTHSKSAALVLFKYLRQKGKIGFRQMQQVSSALSFHLPPASPPIFLLAILPIRPPSTTAAIAIEAAAASTTPVTSNLSPFATNAIARKLALASLGVAILSWADNEVRKKKRLTPLPIFCYSSLFTNDSGIGSSHEGGNSDDGLSTSPSSTLEENRIVTTCTRDLKSIVLPPFLPEEVIIDDYDDGAYSYEEEEDIDIDTDTNSAETTKQTNYVDDIDDIDERNTASSYSLSMKNYRNNFHQLSIPLLPKPKTFIAIFQNWYQMKQIQRKQEEYDNRQSIMSELIELQILKRKQMSNSVKKRRWYRNSFKTVSPKDATSSPLGYALVTGASRGLGRAFAVELARYEIPLILVARDEERLSSLASDIQAAYGIPCVIVKADLSKRGTAREIYETTKKAGLKVDILINNAGVCTTKDIIETSEEDIEQMMDVNVGSTTILSHLYAKEMKLARRGRILFVSSMTGAVPSGPGVATYSATKAYEKSLAQSMGRELEKYGVGVTCLMPGPVKDTSFASRSNANDALCFKVPFVVQKAQHVVSTGVRAVLYSGDGEVTPGWLNRFFLKIVVPVLPPRLTSSIIALAWTPVHFPWHSSDDKISDSHRVKDTSHAGIKSIESTQERISLILNERPPRILKLPNEVEKEKIVKVMEEKQEPEDKPELLGGLESEDEEVVEEDTSLTPNEELQNVETYESE